MNAGMYGVPGGLVSQGRKLARQLRNAAAIANVQYASSGQAGAASVATSAPIGVRSPAMNVAGRGAVRFLGVRPATTTATDIRLEVVVDGVVVYDETANCASLAGIVAIGTFAYDTAAMVQWDYVPFETSLQIFVTSSVTANPILLYVVDIHQ